MKGAFNVDPEMERTAHRNGEYLPQWNANASIGPHVNQQSGLL